MHLHEIVTDPSGNVHVLGIYGHSVHFQDTTIDAKNDGINTFLACYDKDGNRKTVLNIKSDKSVFGNGAVVNDKGEIFITGVYQQNIHLTPNKVEEFEGRSGFLVKYDTNYEPIWMKNFGEGSVTPKKVILKNDNIFLWGPIFGKASFGSFSLDVDQDKEYTFMTQLDSKGNFTSAETQEDFSHEFSMDDSSLHVEDIKMKSDE